MPLSRKHQANLLTDMQIGRVAAPRTHREAPHQGELLESLLVNCLDRVNNHVSEVNHRLNIVIDRISARGRAAITEEGNSAAGSVLRRWLGRPVLTEAQQRLLASHLGRQIERSLFPRVLRDVRRQLTALRNFQAAFISIYDENRPFSMLDETRAANRRRRVQAAEEQAEESVIVSRGCTVNSAWVLKDLGDIERDIGPLFYLRKHRVLICRLPPFELSEDTDEGDQDNRTFAVDIAYYPRQRTTGIFPKSLLDKYLKDLAVTQRRRQGKATAEELLVQSEPFFPSEARHACRDGDLLHPHVQTSILCEGDGVEGLTLARIDGRLYDLFSLTATILRTYVPDSAYWTFEELRDADESHEHDVTCARCGTEGNTDDEDERWTSCNICGIPICGDCEVQIGETSYCQRHAPPHSMCDRCGDNCLEANVSTCPGCGQTVCTDCNPPQSWSTCSGCEQKFCPRCHRSWDEPNRCDGCPLPEEQEDPAENEPDVASILGMGHAVPSLLPKNSDDDASSSIGVFPPPGIVPFGC